MVVRTIASRASPDVDPTLRAVRTGAQAGLVALLIVNMTFTFNGIGVTSLIGLLVGLSAASCARPGVRARSRAPHPSPLLSYR